MNFICNETQLILVENLILPFQTFSNLLSYLIYIQSFPTQQMIINSITSMLQKLDISFYIHIHKWSNVQHLEFNFSQHEYTILASSLKVKNL